MHMHDIHANQPLFHAYPLQARAIVGCCESSQSPEVCTAEGCADTQAGIGVQPLQVADCWGKAVVLRDAQVDPPITAFRAVAVVERQPHKRCNHGQLEQSVCVPGSCAVDHSFDYVLQLLHSGCV